MWGRAKLGPLLRAQGFAVSDATVGRILADLVARGVVEPVPTLRRRPYARRWTAKRRFAQRLPRDLAADEPGGLVQLDAVFVNLTPTKAIKQRPAAALAADERRRSTLQRRLALRVLRSAVQRRA